MNYGRQIVYFTYILQ